MVDIKVNADGTIIVDSAGIWATTCDCCEWCPTLAEMEADLDKYPRNLQVTLSGACDCPGTTHYLYRPSTSTVWRGVLYPNDPGIGDDECEVMLFCNGAFKAWILNFRHFPDEPILCGWRRPATQTNGPIGNNYVFATEPGSQCSGGCDDGTQSVLAA